jgi:hypothetical protein
MGKVLLRRHPNCRPHREGTLDAIGDSVAETTGSRGSASTGEKCVFGVPEIPY